VITAEKQLICVLNRNAKELPGHEMHRVAPMQPENLISPPERISWRKCCGEAHTPFPCPPRDGLFWSPFCWSPSNSQ